MKTLLASSRNFTLAQEVQKNKTYYRITYKSVNLHDQLEEIRDMLDPDRNLFIKKVRFQYRFTDQDLAEKNYTMLVLRWP